MDEQEKKDLEAMLEKTRKAKLDAFDYMASVLRYSPRDMETSGFGSKTKAEAVEYILTRAVKEVQKLSQDHVRKYPD